MSSSILRPAEICQALLAALEGAEGRRRRRKRDQTPDTIGLTIKRAILERAVKEDPAPEKFEEWLLAYCEKGGPGEPSGAVFAIARSVLEEWRMAHSMGEFKEWLEHGAPSDDAKEPERTKPSVTVPSEAGRDPEK